MAALPKGNAVERAAAPQGKSLGPAVIAQDNSLVLNEDLLRTLLRMALAESGWKHEAVAAAMSKATGQSIDGPYLSKMLSGEKSISVKHLHGLPRDIESIFARLYAESFGLIVVVPSGGHDAVRNLVSGLFGLLAPSSLPAKADHMAKAGLEGQR